jgi:peroxiredoxin
MSNVINKASKVDNMMTVVRLFFITALSIFSGIVLAQNQVPNTEIKTLEGQSVNIQEYTQNGKITILSFWATWCSPCKKELDAIADIYEDWQTEYDLELVAISIDNTRALAKVKPMVQEKSWPYTILTDSNQDLMRSLQFQSIPQTFLLDKEGNIVYTHTGYLPGDEDELELEIQKIK